MPPHPPSLIDLLYQAGSFCGYTLLLTIAVIIFAARIVINRWGMGYRLALIPISFIPFLAGIGAAGWRSMNDLGQTAAFGHALTHGSILNVLRQDISIIAITSAQTLLLLIVTAWTLLKYQHGPLATLTPTHPAA